MVVVCGRVLRANGVLLTRAFPAPVPQPACRDTVKRMMLASPETRDKVFRWLSTAIASNAMYVSLSPLLR